MKKPLILFFIPSETISKELLPRQLGEFGKSRDKTVAAIELSGASHIISDNSEMLLFRDNYLDEKGLKAIKQLVDKDRPVYIATHKTSTYESAQIAAVKDVHVRRLVTHKSYHRSESDHLYTAFTEFLACVDTQNKESKNQEYQKALQRLLKKFDINNEIDQELQKCHETLGQNKKSTLKLPGLKGVTVLWNDDAFGMLLKKRLGNKNVITSEAEFQQRLPKIKSLLILAELSWHDKRPSQMYGYEVARMLFESENALSLAFISFMDRARLKKGPLMAGIMVPIFKHYKLPEVFNAEEVITVPDISPIKWVFIRKYVLEKGGIVDKLEHDIKYLNEKSSLADIQKVLDSFERYADILNEEILDTAESMTARRLKDPEKMAEFINVMLVQLDQLKIQLNQNKTEDCKKTTYKLMIVEDREPVLATLAREFGRYFVVRPFSDGEAALKALNKDKFGYSAILVDLRLEDHDNNWQPVQGVDVIEAASKIPHIAIYALTAYSKRAVSTTTRQFLSHLNRPISVMYKSPDKIIPEYTSYAELSLEIIQQISENAGFMKGPKIGLWAKNGLLAYYYRVASPPLWEEVIDNVEHFLNSDNGSIATQFPQMQTTRFNENNLKTLLSHRLICLHSQYADGYIDFNEGLRKRKGFTGNLRGNLAQYFNTYLGLSRETDKQERVYVQNINLFPEEVQWLRKQFPEAARYTFPELYDLLDPFRMNFSRTYLKKLDLQFPPVLNVIGDFIEIVNTVYKLIKASAPFEKTDQQSYRGRISDWSYRDVNLLKDFIHETQDYLSENTTEITQLEDYAEIVDGLTKISQIKLMGD